jgi:phage-related baseplate assembly protein
LRITGIPKTLGPADPTRIVIKNSCQLVTQLRGLIDFAAKENLIKYSHEAYLDNVAALYGNLVIRLPAAPATTTVRFTITAPVAFPVPILAGTECTGPSQLIFATNNLVTIPPLGLSVDVIATCTTPGVVGNGYTAGQINAIVNWGQAFGMTVSNLDTTEGGADIESDPSLRYRTYLAPESQNTCGAKEGYIFWARSATPALLDCAIVSFPTIAGEVWPYPLMNDGSGAGRLPTQAEMDLVYAACSAEIRRPVADFVTVKPPEVVNYTVDVTYIIYRDYEKSAPSIIAAVEAAAQTWMNWTRSRVGRDILPSKLIHYLMVPGIKYVIINSPAPAALEEWEVAFIDPSIPPVITFGGYEDE